MLQSLAKPKIIGTLLLTALVAGPSFAKSRYYDQIVSSGFMPIEAVSVRDIDSKFIKGSDRKKTIASFCQRINQAYKKYRWKEDACGQVNWNAELQTGQNNPLIFAEFGKGPQTTLVLGGVHADELTPIPLAFRFATYLQAHPEVYEGTDLRIIIAPIANPDGFLIAKPTRTNANGVDTNRNFFTEDWYDDAKKRWRHDLKSNPRVFPGHFPNSEIETLFQISLIETFAPVKIVSLHAPLTFLDYDGPGDRKFQMTSTERKAKQLVHEISDHARNYKVVDYMFFPGSLGNFAGNERRIPTVTLELSTTNPAKVDEIWRQFLPGLLEAVRYKFYPDKNGELSSLFFRQYRPFLNKSLELE